MERVEVAATATVGDLRAAIQAKLDVPVEKQTLSVNQALLMSKNPAAFTDMMDAKATLKKLNIAHGAMVSHAWFHPGDDDAHPSLYPQLNGEPLARETASKKWHDDSLWPNNASSAVWSSTPSPQRSISSALPRLSGASVLTAGVS
jgi:hypothetical protein